MRNRTASTSSSRKCANTSPSSATGAWLRDFWSYDARTDEYAIRERRVRSARDG